MTSLSRYSIIFVIFSAVMWNSSAVGKIFVGADTLRGIEEFGIMINKIPDEFKRAGLTKEQIRTDIELKLRLAGIKVLPTVQIIPTNWESEDRTLHVAPHLDVYIFGDKTEYLGGSYLFFVQISFKQMALIERDPNISLLLTSWEVRPVIGIHRDIDEIRQTVKDQVDKFLNAYLSVNPKHQENITK